MWERTVQGGDLSPVGYAIWPCAPQAHEVEEGGFDLGSDLRRKRTRRAGIQDLEMTYR